MVFSQPTGESNVHPTARELLDGNFSDGADVNYSEGQNLSDFSELEDELIKIDNEL